VVRGGAAVLFVSHNLKTVADFCDRCLLLDKGKTVTIGTPQEVISTYLHKSSGEHAANGSSGPVRVSSVKVRDADGESMQFRSGQKAWVDVELTAIAACKKVSVTLYMRNDRFDLVFDTSTDRLGYNACDMEAGDVYRCTFELDLNLVDGTYYPSVVLYRYDIQTVYDRWEPAATIYLSSDGAVRGIANCFPRVIQQQIRRVADPAPLAVAAAEWSATRK
jgi:hypothetical protein